MPPKGQTMSPEQRAKIAAKLRGRKDSVLTRQRKQEAQQDRRTLELMARKLIEQTRELNAEERALAAAKEVKRDRSTHRPLLVA